MFERGRVAREDINDRVMYIAVAAFPLTVTGVSMHLVSRMPHLRRCGTLISVRSRSSQPSRPAWTRAVAPEAS